MFRLSVSATSVLFFLIATNGHGGQTTPRGELGSKVKLTILVDKVMQPHEKWVTKEWMIKAAADAGFNVYSPRVGHDRLNDVKQVTEWCQKHGIYHMPWMRGSLEAPKGPKADGRRYVSQRGREMSLWSPNSDEFWEWTHKHIVEYAKLSSSNRHLLGVFLDYENYAPERDGNCYTLSYDNLILDEFAGSKGIQLPPLECKDRRQWLETRGLHDEFSRFQIAHWRERCRALRKAVDAHDPAFQFCIYPAPGTAFMVEATYPEWATAKAPLILADASTYGRPLRLGRQTTSLEVNRERLLKRMEVPKAAGIPFLYAGGIDPVVRGADPEFSGKNAVMISETTNGYWIFYEGPAYTKQDHADYWKWFTWANQAIRRGDLAAWKQPRQDEEDFASGEFTHNGQRFRLLPPKDIGKTVRFPEVRLRGENVFFLPVRKGQRVEVKVQHVPVASYQAPVQWSLFDSRIATLASGTIPQGQQGTIAFTPQADDLCHVVATAEGCAWSIVESNAPVGLYAGQGISLIQGAQRLYFTVPGNVDRFTLSARGAGRETVRVNIFDPAGKQVATGQTTPAKDRVEIPVRPAENAGKVWALGVTRADEGTLEDNTIVLDPTLAPILSFVPEHAFDVAPAEDR